MKVLHLTIIAVAILLLVPVLVNNSARGGCAVPVHPDWPSAPCWGCPGCVPDKETQREEWAPYYQYKGAIWMEMMKTQMIDAMKNGTLEDWVTGNDSNYDVWNYYYLNNQAPFFRSSVSGLNDEHPYFPPPLQQLTTGIAPKDVACKKGLNLVLNAEDGSPACVKPDTAQKLIQRGWESSLLVSTTNTLSKNACGQFYVAPDNQHDSRVTPALLMGTNSTACVRLTFTIVSNYKDCNGFTCQNMIELGSTLHVGNLHYEKHDNMFSISSGKDYTSSFVITTIPDAVNLENYPVGANFTVIYIIKPLANATGFYDQSIPKLACERYPLAVGYAADQVNASDFDYIDPLNPPCVSGVYTLTEVEIAGMGYKEVALP